MTFKERATALYEMIGQGKSLEALDQFYADHVVVQDNTAPLREGKEAQRAAIQQWFGMVKEYHSSGVSSITSDEDNGITTVESWTEITFQDGNRIKMEEVGVQKWEGDKIVHERFYYQMDQPSEG